MSYTIAERWSRPEKNCWPRNKISRNSPPQEKEEDVEADNEEAVEATAQVDDLKKSEEICQTRGGKGHSA